MESPHRIVGLIAFNGVFAEPDLPNLPHYEAVLGELASLDAGLPLLCPSGYGDFVATPRVVRRSRVMGIALDDFLRAIVEQAFQQRTHEALFLLDVGYTPDEDIIQAGGDDALALSIACAIVADTLRSWVFAANIARPASISSANVEVFANSARHEYERHRLINSFWASREYVARTGWPEFSELGVVDTWEWLAKNLFTVRTGDSALSRAFNSYTYLYSTDLPSPFDLVICLIGIEALYGSGRPGVAAQIVERAQLVLGPRQEFKADLRQMYEMRSAVVHGLAGFPPFLFPYAAPEGYARRRDKLDVATSVATAVLIASLQRCVFENWTHLSFSETVAGRHEDYDQDSSEEIGWTFVRYRRADLDAYLNSRLLSDRWPPPPPDAV